MRGFLGRGAYVFSSCRIRHQRPFQLGNLRPSQGSTDQHPQFILLGRCAGGRLGSRDRSTLADRERKNALAYFDVGPCDVCDLAGPQGPAAGQILDAFKLGSCSPDLKLVSCFHPIFALQQLQPDPANSNRHCVQTRCRRNSRKPDSSPEGRWPF